MEAKDPQTPELVLAEEDLMDNRHDSLPRPFQGLVKHQPEPSSSSSPSTSWDEVLLTSPSARDSMQAQHLIVEALVEEKDSLLQTIQGLQEANNAPAPFDDEWEEDRKNNRKKKRLRIFLWRGRDR
ncbi:hypothetical protein F511_26892 [Dorcoceras hygrometricum]|uniref:Uncharacterized protein n=1 Tax=Dorcoceras hygrometricum TaxID=472368 RepID=A0A2Z7A5Y7_9LAMI|nr:hypothetical protein F511_26892 [Dorcoceras hygrometricum]